MLFDIPATALGLASFYALVSVVQDGRAYTPFRSGGAGQVTASDDLFLFLLSILMMSAAFAPWLFVFLREER